MLKDLLSNRLFLGAFVFFVLIVGGTQWYSWYVKRRGKAEFERTQQAVQALKKKNKTHTATGTQPVEFEAEGFVDTPLEIGGTQRSEETEALPAEDVDFLDIADAFLLEDIGEIETPEARVSPFGFGPYPDVPEDYIAGHGLPIWYEHNFDNQPATATHERNVELIDRVLIKLWKEGKDVLSGFYRYGKVYPLYSKSAYVKYHDRIHDEGYSTGLMVIESPDFDIKLTIEQLQNGNIPAGYQVFELDNSGLDPYAFLGL